MAVDQHATDFLSLNTITGMSAHGTWNPQNHSDDQNENFSQVLDGNGDVGCESDPYGGIDEISAVYGYCPNAANELGTALQKILLGDTHNGFCVTSIAIAATNSGPLQFTFTGHNHDEQAHAGSEAQYQLPSSLVTILNAADPKQGVIDWFSKETGGSVGAQSSSLNFACEHTDVEYGAGDHLAGDNSLGRIDASVEYAGAASGEPAAEWSRDTRNDTKSNNAPTTSSISAHQFVTRQP